MEFAIAEARHLDGIVRIMNSAKEQLRGLGIDQWQYGVPNREMWEEDIRLGRAVVALEEGKPVGAFAFVTGHDPSYDRIEGEWLLGDHLDYAGLHRVCVAEGCKGKGIAGAMFKEGVRLAKTEGLRSLRIDTHPGNFPMQRAIAKGGFTYCGKILLASGPEGGHLRLAYELPIPD
ncbi:MAG: GNAT family N-acetyltransferase [Clostridiales bacterium]|nr:GNAT family N-acetyltransferase [Clostridiales bacterium]